MAKSKPAAPPAADPAALDTAADPATADETLGAVARAVDTAVDGVAERLVDAANAQPHAEPMVVVAFVVKARRAGFRRAGRAWGTEATRVEVADLTDEQADELLAEPMLDVVGIAE